MDDLGRRSGYAYEYQQKIAAYTGWTYEYVEGGWPELMQMLIDGEIDLMSDVSYTAERSEGMLFSSLPMGTEEYYIFTAPDNTDIRQEDPHTLDGKKIGADKGSVQAGLFQLWAEQNGIQSELIEVSGSEYTSLQKLQTGELDAFLTLDAYGNEETAVPKFKVGSSNFFFAVSKERPDLLEELNAALSRIQDENRFFNQQMSLKYISTSGANLFLNMDELNWLSERDSLIRVGYQDNFLAFSAADETTGELKGALKDYLDHAAVCFKNAKLVFEPVAYPNAAAAIEALKAGEVDCVFPSNLSTADGEALDLVMTPEMMSSDIYAVVRKEIQDSFSQKRHVTVAIEENDPNYIAVMQDHFPGWKSEYYPDMQTCLKAVSEGKADCVLISNYQYNSLSRQIDRYNLTMLATGGNVDFYFAVNRGDNALYSILTRTTNLVSHTTIDAALNHYSSVKTEITVGDFIRSNPVLVGAVVVAVLALIVVIIIQQQLIVARRRADESEHKVENLSKQVYVDALTHVRNKGGFDNNIQQLQARLDEGEALDLAIGIFDCNNLKRINDQCGHDRGNDYLMTSCRLICSVFQHSPVFRIGGDEFAVILTGEDFENREALLRQFQDEQTAISSSTQNQWESISVACGIAVFDGNIDHSLKDLTDRADQLMYENKRAKKKLALEKRDG